MIRSSFLSSSVAAAAVAAYAAPAQAQPAPLSLRVAATPNDTFASAYYAQDLGYFTRAGLDVDLQSFTTGATIAAAIVGGAIDIGVAVPVTIAFAHLRGLPLVIVAAGSLSVASVPGLRLAVLKGSPIKTAGELEGKTVAINALGVGLDLSLHAWMAQNGADYSKVKLAEVTFSEMGAAMQRGTVDASVITEPAFTVAAQQYGAVMLVDLDTAVGPRFLNSVWFTTHDFAQSHPEHIKRFQSAIYAVQKWANTHNAQTAVILAKVAKMDLSLVKAMTRSPWADQLRAVDVQPFLDTAAKYGALPHPIDANDLIYQT
jgi:NitT/TauT family transport system substrate-binding protein